MSTKSQAVSLLARVAVIWPRQTTDDATANIWAEVLEPVEYHSAVKAVMEFCDTGREEPPTVGQIKLLALEIESRKAERARALRKAIYWQRSPEDTARGKAALQDIIKSIGRRVPAPPAAEVEAVRASGEAWDSAKYEREITEHYARRRRAAGGAGRISGVEAAATAATPTCATPQIRGEGVNGKCESKLS